jgi:alkanesulfonate monooxygenase SsuD/methylene tetrahydromethanopterin reductase-like flavin-dependent oxidoreductase (luciferase family)
VVTDGPRKPLQLGVWLPSYCYPGLTYDQAQRAVLDYSRACNSLGYDIWVIDHLLPAPGVYGVSWMEPLHVLSAAGAVAPDVKLGTGILVLPLRQPVMLAKQIATIDFLTGGRYLFGVGPGWHAREFAATGIDVTERGRRTDEILAAVIRLLTEDDVTFHGRYYKFEHVTLEPRPPKLPEIFAGGGSRVPDQESPDAPMLADRVLNRILKADWWLSDCPGNQEFVKRDWATIQAALNERSMAPNSVRFAHCNFTYLVETSDRRKALEIQRKQFGQVIGDRTFEDLQQSYLLGSLDDIIERLVDLKDAGMEYLVLGPRSDDPKQLDLIAKHVKPALS